MNTKTVPFTAEQLENIIAQYPTPFHIYDEEGIIENMKAFINAFSWNKGFKQYFAVKKWALQVMILCSHLMTHHMWNIKKHLN